MQAKRQAQTSNAQSAKNKAQKFLKTLHVAYINNASKAQ
jgi:hypothetical protein